MGLATPTTPVQPAGAAGATPATPAPAAGANATGDAPQQGSAPAIDWENIDYSTVPWDKIGDKVPIDKLPGAQKMQSTLRKQLAEQTAAANRAQAAAVAAQKMAEQLGSLVKNQGPQYQQQVSAFQAQAEAAQLQERLAQYERHEALQRMAEHYGVPADVILNEPVDRPEQAFERVINYHRTAGQTGVTELQQQVQELTRQLAALTAVRTDPAARADRGAAVPSTNLQTLYNEAAKKLDGPGAERVRRQAEEAGIELDLTTAWRG